MRMSEQQKMFENLHDLNQPTDRTTIEINQSTEQWLKSTS